MIWSTEDELKATVRRVRQQCEALASTGKHSKSVYASSLAPGVELDKWLHKDDEISVEPFLSATYKPSPSMTRDRAMPEEPDKPTKETIPAIDTAVVDEKAFQDTEEKEVKIIAVKGEPTV